ncbi:hypothetical protein MRX96_002654 [Rhipicephalus microplus]
MFNRKGLFWKSEGFHYGYSTPYQLFDAAKGSLSFVQKLRLEVKLPVHNGCVNTICWNDAGTYLLSGSDDQHLCITNAHTHVLLAHIRTGHTANIFSAKFLPSSGDRLVVSCSGDGAILFSDVERPRRACETCSTAILVQRMRLLRFQTTHTAFSRAVKMARCAGLTCARKPAAPPTTVLRMSLLTVTIQLSESLIDACWGTRATGNFMSNSMDAMTSRLTVPEFEGRSHRITSLTYSADGQEILVSYSSDYVYLFDAVGSVQEEPKSYGADGRNCSASEFKQKECRVSMKRLRVRGDWSDTGPNARPECEMRALGEQQPRSLHASLMQRMSDVLTRMFNSSTGAVRAAGTPNRPRAGTFLASSLSSSSSTSPAYSGGDSSTDEDIEATVARHSRSVRLARVIRQRVREKMASRAAQRANAEREQEAVTQGSSSNVVALDLSQPSASTSGQATSDNTKQAKQLGDACPACSSGSVRQDSSKSVSQPVLAAGLRRSPNQSDDDDDAAFQDSVESISENECFQSAAENISPAGENGIDGALLDDLPSAFGDRGATSTPVRDASADNTSEDENTNLNDDSAFHWRRQSATPPRAPSEASLQPTGDSTSPASSRARSVSRQPTVPDSDSVLRAMAEDLHLEKECVEEPSFTRTVTGPRARKRYTGHRNSRTMIKEATFWGNEFVMSGSDCGHIFIWHKETCELVMIMEADHHVVNCLQPHPFDPVLASSGIDYDIKIWAPLREEPFFDAEKAAEMIKRNEVMLEETKDTITVPASFMIRMLASLNHLRSSGSGTQGWRRLMRDARTDDSDSSNH